MTISNERYWVVREECAPHWPLGLMKMCLTKDSLAVDEVIFVSTDGPRHAKIYLRPALWLMGRDEQTLCLLVPEKVSLDQLRGIAFFR